MVSFWQFFEIQMAIFWRVRYQPMMSHLPQIVLDCPQIISAVYINAAYIDFNGYINYPVIIHIFKNNVKAYWH